MSTLDDLWSVVTSIPRGRVSSYGDVGRALDRPVSGVLVGKWMTQSPPSVPWWRVVGRNGDLLVAKRGPEFAAQQRDLLEQEGVTFVDGQVERKFFLVP